LREKGGSWVTYGALESQAQAISDQLKALGIHPGDRVGISRPKSALTVAAIFGILRAGAAYVPVDPCAPKARSAGIFADCQVAAILTTNESSEDICAALSECHPMTRKADISGLACLVAENYHAPGAPDTAYVLYTSGSTGKPKGVVHTHASALAFIDWCSSTFSPTPEDQFTSHAPFHFDLSILDLYVPIKHGASIRIIDADEGKQPAALAKLVEEDKISVWYSTPTILRAMTEFGDLKSRDLSSLRILCFAGEVFPTKHLKALAGYMPKPRYFNLFGPTETNVCTFYELPSPQEMADDEGVPIGYAASGDTLRVVGPDDKKVAVGDEGELLISGGSVMVGYWADPERTAQSFTEIDGQRWYRTGDIVAQGPDQALLYHGRRDRMVKRRGYRIELGEIEAALSRHPDIFETASVSVQDQTGATQIVAFYSWRGAKPPSLIELKRHAARYLPIYMVPDRLQCLDNLPLTSTDKTDYQSLKELANGLFSQ
jgi:amino acid adenylation domain-containing protein